MRVALGLVVREGGERARRLPTPGDRAVARRRTRASGRADADADVVAAAGRATGSREVRARSAPASPTCRARTSPRPSSAVAGGVGAEERAADEARGAVGAHHDVEGLVAARAPCARGRSRPPRSRARPRGRRPPPTARRSSQASSSRREAMATGLIEARTSTESPAPESKRHRSTQRARAADRPRARAGAARRALAVRPPPHGFSRGWEASKTIDSRAVARREARQERARGAGAHDRRPSRLESSSRPRSPRPPLPPASPWPCRACPPRRPRRGWRGRAASGEPGAGAQRARPRVAITVSPAPVTSKTSRAAVGMWSGRRPALEQAHALLAARDERGLAAAGGCRMRPPGREQRPPRRGCARPVACSASALVRRHQGDAAIEARSARPWGPPARGRRAGGPGPAPPS